eukprot:7484262-Pyramimonas_sp.AAC.1
MARQRASARARLGKARAPLLSHALLVSDYFNMGSMAECGVPHEGARAAAATAATAMFARLADGGNRA